MPKSTKERQQLWKLKHKNEDAYKIQRQKINKRYADKKKASETAVERSLHKIKATLRQQKCRKAAKDRKRQEALQVTPQKKSPSVVGKAYKRVEKNFPKSPRTQKAVLGKLQKKYSEQTHTDDKPTAQVATITRKRLDDATEREVIAFYEDEEISRVDPGMKSACARRLKSGVKIKARRYMLFTISEAHSLFREKHPDLVIGRSKFADLRPLHIKPYKDIPHNVCVCKHHENFESLRAALAQVIPCYGSSTNDFLQSHICNTGEYRCMRLECPQCKENVERLFMTGTENDEEIHYKQWKLVEKRFENVIFEKNICDAVEEFQKQLPLFLMHCFNQKTSQAEFKKVRSEATSENVVLQVDFAENYAAQYQNEIQSAHWSNPQVTVFTAVLWFGENDIESYAVVADDISHDRYCVDLFLREIINDHCVKNPHFKKLHVFSDGAASQFKSKFNFANITILKNDFNLKELTWTFFATSHGKGAVDGIGAVVKRAVWNAVRSQDLTVRNAEEFARLCSNLKIKVLLVTTDKILAVKEKLDEVWKDVTTIKGTQKIHHISAIAPYTVLCKIFPNQEDSTEVDLRGSPQCLPSASFTQHSSDAVPEPAATTSSFPTCGQWVAVAYDQQWVPGTIEQMLESGNVKITFMKIVGRNRFVWPSENDFGIVAFNSILTTLREYPEMVSTSGRGEIYSLSAVEYERITDLLACVE